MSSCQQCLGCFINFIYTKSALKNIVYEHRRSLCFTMRQSMERGRARMARVRLRGKK
jgi:hypothetical protein